MKPVLLQHQLSPIKHLVSRCKNQHGLLIHHTMGSGKTYLGVFLAKNFPSHKIIIIIPSGIKNIWKDAVNDVKLKNVTYVTYQEIEKINETNYLKYKELTTNSIIIADEAHNFIDIISQLTPSTYIDTPLVFNKNKIKKQNIIEIKEDDKNKVSRFLDLFSVSKKILLLTGTPIIHGLPDIRWLINIAAGKKIVPYNIMEFTKNFYNISKIKTFFIGWVENMLFFNMFGSFIIPQKYRVSFSGIQYYESELNNIIHALFGKVISTQIKNLIPGHIPTQIKKLTIDTSTPTLRSMLYYKLLKFKSVFGVLSPSTTHITTVLNLVIIGIITKGLYLVVLSIMDTYNDNYSFESLNTSKIKIVSPYISYYTYTKDNQDYPSFTVTNKQVIYTDYQLELWIRLIYNVNITDQESVDLELSKNITDAELFKPVEFSESVYLNKGRIIGNLTLNGNIPLKFKKIAEMFKTNNQSTIVYSNFYQHGCLLLSKYLTEQNITHTLYTPFLTPKEQSSILLKFKEQKIKFIILHPVYFEGFSIQGARIFHVLEPMLQYYEKEQLYTRAIRYKSHTHLKKEERIVKIIQWSCTASNIFDLVRKHRADLNDWFKYESFIFYFNRFSVWKTDLSPDDIINKSINKAEKQLQTFNSTMEKTSIEQLSIKDNCCVYGEMCKKLKKCLV